ncbi:hypothetical protein J6S88_07265 [bacterium]|nr:hypothetical protein [bacterium]
MKVNSISQKIYKSLILKKGLEFAADNGTLFVAGTSLFFSTFIRPASTLLTPNVDKENRRLPFVKSVASALVYFLVTLGLSLPLAKGIKKIDERPLKYLKAETVKALGEEGKSLYDSKAYQFATQLFKLGLGFLIAAPKAIATDKLLAPILKFFCKDSESLKQNNDKVESAQLQFAGSKDIIPRSVGKILDKEGMQQFSQVMKNTNFRMHIIALTDILSTAAYTSRVKKNNAFKEEKKGILINNALISTGLCLGLSYPLDKALNKPTQRFIRKFCAANKGDKNLAKYVEGIKLAKPALILGTVYYGLIPVISTFWADRIEKGKNSVNIS